MSEIESSDNTKVPKRQSWDSSWDMAMSIICVTIGMGNFWKFPFICIANGGAAFLIPYIVVITILVRPIFYLEVSMGTFTGCCNTMMFAKMGKMWKGIGITQCIVFLISNTSYAYIMSISLFYLTHSFAKVLPWDVCVKAMGPRCIPTGNSTMYNSLEYQRYASAYLYLEKTLMTHHQHGYKPPEWRMYIVMFLTWAVVAAMVSNNIKSFTKMAYFIAIFPTMIMFILFLRSTLRQGSYNGAKFFFAPDWWKIIHIESWIAAINHSIFSFSLGIGALSLYGSYSNVHTDIRAISIVIILVDLFSSVLCCVSVYCSMGTISFKLGIDLKNIEFEGGMHLAFVTYPTAISYFDKPAYLFAVMFFSMLFMLGVGTLCAGCHVVASCIHEYYPNKFSYHMIGLMICLFGFLSGIFYASYYGQQFIAIIDFYVYVMGVLIIIIAECGCFIFGHGLRNLCWDIEFVVSSNVHYYWRYCWTFVAPLIVTLYTIMVWSSHDQSNEIFTKVAGHTLVLLNCLPMLYYLISELCRCYKTNGNYSLLPKTYWHPRLEADRHEYRRFIVAKRNKWPVNSYFHDLREALVRKYY